MKEGCGGENVRGHRVRVLVSRLETEGARVIGIDRHEAEICADLAVPAERRAATARIAELAPGGIEAALVPDSWPTALDTAQ